MSNQNTVIIIIIIIFVQWKVQISSKCFYAQSFLAMKFYRKMFKTFSLLQQNFSGGMLATPATPASEPTNAYILQR